MIKSILATALLFFPTLTPTQAAVKDPFSPTNIRNKTIQFSIEGGVAPLATMGTWTGTFLTKPANRLAIRNISGNTVSGSGVWKYIGSPFKKYHSYTITPFFPPNEPATITFWPEDKGFRYFIDGGDATQWGVIAGPEIVVQQPAGSKLTTDKSKRSFGTVEVGERGKPKVFKIKNNGNADMNILSIRKKGAHAGNFIVGKLKKKTLKPGKSTTFEVAFKPSSKGTRQAAIQIFSNDVDENPFLIKLSGTGKK